MTNQQSARTFLNKVEQFVPNKSSPFIIKKLLSELKLDKFSTHNTNFLTFLDNLTMQPTDLHALRTAIKTALLDNEPLVNLFAYIEENHLISEQELQHLTAMFSVQFNLLCLFEAFTVTLANSTDFLDDVYRHIMQQRHSLDSGSSMANFIASRNISLFERLKLISIDPGILGIMFHRSTKSHSQTPADLEQFIKKYHLSGLNAHLDMATLNSVSHGTLPAMRINIIEAVWEELASHLTAQGSYENALAGLGLISLMQQQQYPTQFNVTSLMLPEYSHKTKDNNYSLLPDLILHTDDKNVSQFLIDKEWQHLYNSWNLHFVILNIDALFMPLKLLLPSVLNAAPENYKEVRILSLFFIGNLFLNEHITDNLFFTNQYHLAHADQLLLQWGKINQDYASHLLTRYCPKFNKDLEHVYQETFGSHLTINFAKHLVNYLYQPEPVLNQEKPAKRAYSPSFFTPNKTASLLPDEQTVGLSVGPL